VHAQNAGVDAALSFGTGIDYLNSSVKAPQIRALA
jgi:hypothetical protein